tara:strand:- start:23082 stop:23810 length:729 start_codon:yes stop_codon:yes gene_type:complete
MAKKQTKAQKAEDQVEQTDQEITKPDINSLEWNDYVLGLLSEEEKISGNPTTDGLRRIFEIALDCTIIDSTSEVVQSPSPDNEKRATVVHSLNYILNNESLPAELRARAVNGAADVYWGNCDKVYRNHPVAVAETRAEGRALRRGLKLRKVIAAEEVANEIEDDPDGINVSKITNNQINFIDVLSKRLNINVNNMLTIKNITESIYNVSHKDAVILIRDLSKYQQNLSDVPDNIIGYDSSWK